MNEMQELKDLTLLSDDDLRRVWLQNELEKVDRGNAPSWYRKKEGITAITLCIVCGLSFITLLIFGWTEITLFLSILYVGLVYGVFSYGWPQWRGLRAEVRKKARNLDLNDPKAMSEIVEALCSPPIRHANDLRRGIAHDMRMVRYAQEDLEKMVRELTGQIKNAQIEYARELLNGRLDDAERAIKNLNVVLSQLGGQMEEIDAAIHPVEELYGKFVAIWSVNHQVERIQVAYRLSSEAVDRIEVRRKEIDHLYKLTDEAEFRLKELATSLEAERRARLEVRDLINGASAIVAGSPEQTVNNT